MAFINIANELTLQRAIITAFGSPDFNPANRDEAVEVAVNVIRPRLLERGIEITPDHETEVRGQLNQLIGNRKYSLFTAFENALRRNHVVVPSEVVVPCGGRKYTIISGQWSKTPEEEAGTEKALSAMWGKDTPVGIARALGFFFKNGLPNPAVVITKAKSLGLGEPPKRVGRGKGGLQSLASDAAAESERSPFELERPQGKRGVWVKDWAGRNKYLRIIACEFIDGKGEICGKDSEPSKPFCPECAARVYRSPE